MTMTAQQAAQAGQLALDWPDALSTSEIAFRLREQDRNLGTLLPPEVEVRSRRNRSTLGSLRLSRDKPSVWRFTVAADLLERDPQAALDLGLLLLHRARRQPPPEALRIRLAGLRAGWESPRGRRPRGLLEDPALPARLAAVQERSALGMPPGGLPGIVWVDSASRRVMGRYDSRARRIELHLALRDPAVPDHVLDNLIFHELLHAVLAPKVEGSRLVHHHAEFRRREKAFPAFGQAEAWSRDQWPRHVARHLRRRRTG
jgi:hypothetical protein